jgi:hypothetical protein
MIVSSSTKNGYVYVRYNIEELNGRFHLFLLFLYLFYGRICIHDFRDPEFRIDVALL